LVYPSAAIEMSKYNVLVNTFLHNVHGQMIDVFSHRAIRRILKWMGRMGELLCPQRLAGGSLCPEVGRCRCHVKGADVAAVTPRMMDVVVVSLHPADDAVSLLIDRNDVTENVWSSWFAGK